MSELHDELIVEVVAEGRRSPGDMRRSSSEPHIAEVPAVMVDVSAQSCINQSQARPHPEAVIAFRGRPPGSVHPGSPREAMRRNDTERQAACFTGVTGDTSEAGATGDTGNYVARPSNA
ncbi:hypothetical protein GCM10022256_22320 [Frondihabitans peucedani]|uniref:Uncharacterized protein n=1 Tax=Frondihabitans peucedani TaxID=598626 RepID=A0ABP8E3L5_9MICO